MTDQAYAVVFDGTVADGQDVAAVKQRLQRLFKITESQVERLFTGRPVTLKKGLSPADAQRFAAAFAQAGALCKLVQMSPPSSQAAAPQPLSVEAIDQLFHGEFAQRAPALSYRLGLAGMALVMLCLPLAYLAMIVGTAAAVIWYVSGGVPVPSSRSLYAMLFYTLPIFAGVTVVLFLLKPLFAPRLIERLPIDLTRARQPLLFAFVDAIADKVGAPKPRNIEVDCEVNAAAGFYRGFRGLWRNELTLTIGLPLIAGMTTRQLAGVLAHEFGHFSQRGGMLATYVIRRITFAFHRAVEERDSWDAWLDNWVDSREGSLALPALAAQAGIGLVRRILTAFAWLADLLSYYMLRQMEFDADTYEARLAGSDQFRDTAIQLRRLDHAFNEVYRDLGELWQRRQLVDDLPATVAQRAGQLPAQTLKEIEAALLEERQDFFSTHPPDESRIAAAQQLGAAGIFTLEQPANQLLRNSAEISRQVTLRFYRHDLGLDVTPEQLVSNTAMAAVVDEAKAQEAALRDYFRGLLVPGRFLAPAEDAVATETTPYKQRLDDLIPQIRRSLPDIENNNAAFSRLNERLGASYAAHILSQQSHPLVQAFVQDIPNDYLELQNDLAKITHKMAVPEGLQMRRLALALQGATQWVELDASQRDRIEPALVTARTLKSLQEARNQLYLAGAALFYGLQVDQFLHGRTEGKESLPASFYESHFQHIRRSTETIESLLRRLQYPLERAGGGVSVWEHLEEYLPAPNEAPHGHIEFVQALDYQLQQLYEQLMRFLAGIALRYERHLGVEPLSIQVRKATA